MHGHHKIIKHICYHSSLSEGQVLVVMLLDLVEVVESHSGMHLAVVFMKILEDFAIIYKVSTQSSW
jgi:hypothetical protein